MTTREVFVAGGDSSRKGFGGKSGDDGDWGTASFTCSDIVLAVGTGNTV
jgi:hypothetical protein